MAQNPYLQNLLGINQGGTGLYNYNYSLPNYNTLLSQGLTEDQIKGYDTGFNTFNQFPYQAQVDTQMNYPQYGVVPQAPGVDPITTDTQIDTVSESVTPRGVDYSSNVQDTVSTPYGDFTSDDFTQDIYTYPSNKPMNQMTEQELMAFGQSKGYIDEDGRLTGSMQVDTDKLGLYGGMISKPAQIMNDKQYDWFLDSLNQKGMMLGGAVDAPQFAQHSPKFQEKIKITEFFNNRLSDDKQRGLSASKIPGTFKSVQTLKNTYAPSGRDDNNVIYHTSTGGHYNNEGKFITGYGQQARYGSMTDAIDTITAAAQSGNTSTVPSKFDQKWFDKQMKNVNLSTPQKNELEKSWDKVKSQKKSTTRDMTKDQHVRVKSQPKQKDTKKDYGPKSTAESTRAIKDKLESGKSVGGGDSVSRFKAQERARSKPAFLS
tara:strand:+ start:163 stop:1452 length:1290 start_codon:yes stop_codon:yes gene_type:complete